jgi:hypothetical protein
MRIFLEFFNISTVPIPYENSGRSPTNISYEKDTKTKLTFLLAE